MNSIPHRHCMIRQPFYVLCTLLSHRFRIPKDHRAPSDGEYDEWTQSRYKELAKPPLICTSCLLDKKLWCKCNLATWRNVPLSTPVKIASRQGKKPLSSRLVLQICHAEMIKRSCTDCSVCFRQHHLGQKALVLVYWTRYVYKITL